MWPPLCILRARPSDASSAWSAHLMFVVFAGQASTEQGRGLRKILQILSAQYISTSVRLPKACVTVSVYRSVWERRKACVSVAKDMAPTRLGDARLQSQLLQEPKDALASACWWTASPLQTL